MKTKIKVRPWLGIFTMAAGIALSVGGSASAATTPSEEVTIVVTDSASGIVLATFDSGIHTGPPGSPPFSANSTQIVTNFSSPGLGGVTTGSGQHTADNSFPSPGGVGPLLQSVINSIDNTSTAARDVAIVVSANGFVPGAGSLDAIDAHGTFSTAQGSSITAKWYEDNGNSLSRVSGTVGSTSPALTLAGNQMGTTYSFTAPDNNADFFSDTQGISPVNFVGPFSMTLDYTFHLTPGAVESNTIQEQATVLAVAPLPGTAVAGLALMGVLLAGGAVRRLRHYTFGR